MTKEELTERRNKAFQNIEEIKVALSLDEHYIDELESENAEQKDQLTKAKEIIKGLLPCCRNYPQENADKMEQAEQFIKDIKENVL